MKKDFNMKNRTQEQLCKTFQETCDLISEIFNPLTGDVNPKYGYKTNDKTNEIKIVTETGYEVPKELYYLFDYSLNNDAEIAKKNMLVNKNIKRIVIKKERKMRLIKNY